MARTPAGAMFAFGMTRTLRRLWLPLAIGLGGVWIAFSGQPVLPGAGRGAAAATGMWLHLPGLLLALAAAACVIDAWPPYSRGRAGEALVARLARRGIDGCVPVSLGGCVALIAALVAAGAGVNALQIAVGVGAPEVRAHCAMRAAVDPPMLDATHRSVVFRAPAAEEMVAVVLRPRAVWDPRSAYAPARIRVSTEGRPLHRGWLEVRGSMHRYDVRFAPRRIAAVTVESESGGLILDFGADGVEGVLAAPRSALANAVMAAVTYVVPAAMALALAAVLRGLLAVPAMMVVITGTVLAAAAGDGLPSGAAVLAHASGRWLPAEGLVTRVAVSLCTVAAVFAVGIFTRPRHRCPGR